MRRLTCIALTLMTLIGTMTMTTTAHAQGRGPCSGWFSNVRPDMNHNGVAADTTDRALVNHRVEHLIACAVRIWPVPGGVFEAIRIAHRESGTPWIWPWAYNPSGCAGVFQHILRFWGGRVSAWWHRDWFWRTPSAFNARANVIITIRMVHADGWDPWT